MTAWTKLAYGSIIAAALAGGTALYYASAPRSTVHGMDASVLIEATLERCAAVSSWPFNTNGDYINGVLQPTEAGWWPSSVPYRTNVSDTAIWNFYRYEHDRPDQGQRLVPLIGSAFPRKAASESLRILPALATNFLCGITTNALGQPVPIYWSQTSLWAALNIGDGTSLWTIGCASNGAPIYSDTVGSVISTVTLWEAWRVANAYTATWKSVTGETISRSEYDPPFQTVSNYDYIETGVYWPNWTPIYEIGWYSNAFWYHHFDDVPDATFQHLRGIHMAECGLTNVPSNPTNYSSSFESCYLQGAWLLEYNDEVWEGGAYSNDMWAARGMLYDYPPWRRSAICSNLVRFASFPSGVSARVDFHVWTTGSLAVAMQYERANGAGITLLSNTTYSIGSNSIQSVDVSFSGLSTASIPVGISVPITLDSLLPGFDSAEWAGYDAASNGYYNPKVSGQIQNNVNSALINWTFKYRSGAPVP